LLSKPSDVAVFWPASGIAAGILIVWGRRAYPALVAGVVVGTVAANLMSDRGFLTALFKGFCNSGEAILAAWLLERWFGLPFKFGDLRRVVGFLAAACLATAASATGGAATMGLLHTAAPYWDVWRAWFLSDGVGIVVVAPLVIGLGQVWREPPSPGEAIEGVGVLSLTALVSFYDMSHQTGSWLSFTPGVIVLPLLLWLVARCQPVFGIAGAFVASVAVIFATTFGFGHFGDAAFPTLERVKGAQVATTMVTLYTLVLTALFAQRQSAEEGLQHREAELAEAQRVARIGSWYWDAQTDVIVGSDELLRIYGLDLATPPADFRAQFDRHYAVDDLERLKEAGRVSMETGVGFHLELQAFRNRTPIWVAARGEVVRNGADQIIGLRGTAQDITERKQTEQALSERNAQLALAAKAALVGSFAYDVRTERIQVSAGYAAIHGLPGGTTETLRRQWRARVHPEDVERMREFESEAFRERRRECNVEYRIIRSDGRVRWIESRTFISYESDGQPQRVVGVNIDITERKQAELALAERNAQLALAGQAALVGSYAYASDLETMKISEGYCAMHGLPKGTTETTRSQWRVRVHRDDLERIEALRAQVFRDKRDVYNVDYRIVHASGEVRWIDSRSVVSYDNDGQPESVIGINIDVTERKQTEARLSDALAAGHVVAFEWNATTRRSQRSDNADRVIGFVEDGRFLRQVRRDDRDNLQTLVRGLSPNNPSYAATFRFVRSDGRQVWLEETAKGEFDRTGQLLRIKGLTRDITEGKQGEDQRRRLNAELDHRVKNTLATVSAVVSQTREGKSSIRDFVEALEGRIQSMAAVHELLSSRQWRGISLTELVRLGLAPYSASNNTETSGPEVILNPAAAQPIAMVFHELATNAAKYGALSNNSRGRVSVRWDCRSDGSSSDRLVIEWRESSGPPVVVPDASGYGTSIIRELIPYEFGGMVDYVPAQDGVRCTLQMPITLVGNRAVQLDPLN
jgi:PAS domain S-box-containing protein